METRFRPVHDDFPQLSDGMSAEPLRFVATAVDGHVLPVAALGAKLLIDESLSRHVAELLADAGHEAVRAADHGAGEHTGQSRDDDPAALRFSSPSSTNAALHPQNSPTSSTYAG